MSARAGRVVFVCAGNICRSPMAEHALRRALAARDVEGVVLASLGLVAQDGDVPVPATLRAAAAVGLDLSAHRATRFDEARLLPGDAVWVMEHEQAAQVGRRSSASGVAVEVRLLGLLAPGESDEIADPEEGTEDIFDACAARLVACAEALADAIVRQRRSGMPAESR